MYVEQNRMQIAKFNKYPKYKSQMLAKTCPRRSTTSWNKEQWKKLTEQVEWQYRKYYASKMAYGVKKALVQILVLIDFLFSFIFLIFFSALGSPE